MNEPNAQHGGPAFPTSQDVTEMTPGMSLRDYFAADALNGFLANPKCYGGASTPALFARDAYMLADAMLKAREVKP